MGLLEYSRHSDEDNKEDDNTPEDEEVGRALIRPLSWLHPSRVGDSASGEVCALCELAIAPVEAFQRTHIVPDLSHAREKSPEGNGRHTGEEIYEAYRVEYLIYTYHVVVFIVDLLALHAGTDEGNETDQSKPVGEDHPPRAQHLIGAF